MFLEKAIFNVILWSVFTKTLFLKFYKIQIVKYFPTICKITYPYSIKFTFFTNTTYKRKLPHLVTKFSNNFHKLTSKAMNIQ